jgi:hypothetical protein
MMTFITTKSALAGLAWQTGCRYGEGHPEKGLNSTLPECAFCSNKCRHPVCQASPAGARCRAGGDVCPGGGNSGQPFFTRRLVVVAGGDFRHRDKHRRQPDNARQPGSPGKLDAGTVRVILRNHFLPGGWWLLLVGWAFIWPHFAWQLSCRAASPHQQEIFNRDKHRRQPDNARQPGSPGKLDAGTVRVILRKG